MDPVVAVPVKDFGSAKSRLASGLSEETRRRLGRRLAERTLAVVREAGVSPSVVTGDPTIAQWAVHLGYGVIDEGHHRGLNGAAMAAAAKATDQDRPWLILHGDLPLLQAGDVERLFELLAAHQFVLCPSYDGGTNGFGGHGETTFAYGPSSFHRHLAHLAHCRVGVISSVGLALDLDSSRDFALLLDHPDGEWLRAALTGG